MLSISSHAALKYPHGEKNLQLEKACCTPFLFKVKKPPWQLSKRSDDIFLIPLSPGELPAWLWVNLIFQLHKFQEPLTAKRRKINSTKLPGANFFVLCGYVATCPQRKDEAKSREWPSFCQQWLCVPLSVLENVTHTSSFKWAQRFISV